ncbi:MAG: glycosyltransferase [Proteiniphilum sp.]|uniref:glycosyltransferase n=1 Tax=Proteiniphilum sp. TaxID=1926877 RepID=UPI002B20600A|nr:glycosyltransferase [Proteiniphilum sp.]MEA5127279.1 glycosyltransferase [Proteiniphilum sp.]
MKKISVCIATYNGSLYLKNQLNSILIQLSDIDEIIISDDSSTDDTIEIIKSIRDSRIKLYENQKFQSPVFNFENALNKATGDFIFLCDQDDIWLPDKVKIMISYLQKYDLVVSDCKVVDSNLNIIYDSFFALMHSGRGFWKNFFKNTYLGCCMAFRKEILNYVLPFPPQLAMHDIWIGLSVEKNGHSFFLKKPLSLYRRHENNASFASERSKNPLLYRIRYRLYIMKSLLSSRK